MIHQNRGDDISGYGRDAILAHCANSILACCGERILEKEAEGHSSHTTHSQLQLPSPHQDWHTSDFAMGNR